jgi:hypothetical protein
MRKAVRKYNEVPSADSWNDGGNIHPKAAALAVCLRKAVATANCPLFAIYPPYRSQRTDSTRGNADISGHAARHPGRHNSGRFVFFVQREPYSLCRTVHFSVIYRIAVLIDFHPFCPVVLQYFRHPPGFFVVRPHAEEYSPQPDIRLVLPAFSFRKSQVHKPPYNASGHSA